MEPTLQTDRSQLSAGALAIGIRQSVVGLGIILSALSVVPQFERIFNGCNTKLPPLTIVVLASARFLANYWYLAVVLTFLWPLLYEGIAYYVWPKSQTVLPRRIWFFATWSILLLAILLAVVGLLFPLITLVSNLTLAR